MCLTPLNRHWCIGIFYLISAAFWESNPHPQTSQLAQKMQINQVFSLFVINKTNKIVSEIDFEAKLRSDRMIIVASVEKERAIILGVKNRCNLLSLTSS